MTIICKDGPEKLRCAEGGATGVFLCLKDCWGKNQLVLYVPDPSRTGISNRKPQGDGSWLDNKFLKNSLGYLSGNFFITGGIQQL